MKNLKIYILTSDKTCDKILEISLYYWKRYWKNDIIVLGFNKGKDICKKFYNVTFYSLGKTQYINEYTYYIYKFFETYCKEKTAIISLDDFFPLKSINYDDLIKINNKILNDDRFVKACLAPCFYLKNTDVFVDGLTCVNKGKYMLNLQLSLWDVDYLKKIFKKKNSPWGLELSEKKDNKLIIKTTNIHSNIFETPIIKNFTCKSIIRTNVSSHFSSPYNKISLLGLKYNEIKKLIKKLKLNEKTITLGHEKIPWFMCEFKNVSNNDDIVKKWKNLSNQRVKKEYYYLYNDIYNFN